MPEITPALLSALEANITAESNDALLYESLAQQFCCPDERQLLLDFAADEHSHADGFQRIYHRLSGRWFQPMLNRPQLRSGSCRSLLRERVLDESGDYRKYGRQYLQFTGDRELSDLFYLARIDENVHALRLLLLLEQTARRGC